MKKAEQVEPINTLLLLICGLIVYTELEEHCPELMGDMTDRNTEEFDKEENK